MPYRVLIVDTNHQTLARDGKALASAGYLVACATSFAEAKRRLSLAPPDLLIADVRLGAYNGLHLVYRLRSAYLDTPAVLQNEAPDVVLEREARAAEAHYLVKPVEAAVLLDTVRGLLAGRPADPATEAARRWQRRRAGITATLDAEEATVVDLSYGGLGLEIPHLQNQRLDRAVEVRLPQLGPIAGRVVWMRTAGDGPSWCGVEIVDDRVAEAWRGYVDSFGSSS